MFGDCVNRNLHHENRGNGDCVRFGAWRGFDRLVCAQGEARGESFKKSGDKN